MWLTLHGFLQEHMIRVTATGLQRGPVTRLRGTLQGCPSSSQPAQAANHTSLPSARSKVQQLVLFVCAYGLHPCLEGLTCRRGVMKTCWVRMSLSICCLLCLLMPCLRQFCYYHTDLLPVVSQIADTHQGTAARHSCLTVVGCCPVST